MACINMYNPEHHCAPPMTSPRISFSNDFVVEQPAARQPAPPSDPNFEFSVGNHPMMAADQLFFKGRLLPLKDNYHSQYGPYGSHGRSASIGSITTLRDELRSSGDEEEHGEHRPPVARGSIKWKEFLGIKNKSNYGVSSGKKAASGHRKNNSEEAFDHDHVGEAYASKSTQDF